MKSNKVNLMTNRVVFLEKKNQGPEVGGALQDVYECYCDAYEPTMKDTTVLNVESNKNAVTLTVRNVYQEFKPKPHHQFRLKSGYFKDEIFNIKSITPYSDNDQFLKIIGEGV